MAEDTVEYDVFTRIKSVEDLDKIKGGKRIAEHVKGERDEHLAAGSKAAAAIIESGAVGAGPWDVQIRGRVSKGHLASDYHEELSVTVTKQQAAQEEAA